jgi:Fic family protein
MLYTAASLDEREGEVLAQIDDAKKKLRWQLNEPKRWNGSLRRLSFARNIQGSNSIEGYEAQLDDAAAVVSGEEPLDADEETRLALAGYCDAMTYVLQLSDDPQFTYTEQLLKSLHFMMTSYAMKNRPGRWRTGTVYVQREEDGEIVYEGADVDLVPELMSELVAALNESADDHPIVCGAMAHLNLVMVHPFRDGNGRMARCLQSLVLARNGVLSPVFMSVEEYLGRNTPAYYDVLASVGKGAWNPGNDPNPWIRFMLTAHLRQAQTLITRVRESERLWVELDSLAAKRGLPERAVTALYDAAFGMRVRNGTYRAFLDESGEEISEQTASADLRRMVEADLLQPWGEKRGRHYVASQELRDIMMKIRADRQAKDRSDPFAN